MSIIKDPLEKFIRLFIIDTVGVPGYSISADNNNPRPDSSYSTVRLASASTVGYGDTAYVNQVLPDTDLEENKEELREIFISLNFFKGGAFENADLIRTALKRSSAINRFNDAQLGFISVSEVRNISETIDSKFENRAQMDLVLSTVSTDMEIVNAIESASITLDLHFPGNETQYIIEVN